MRLFLDANVLFTAAHNPRGKAALVIELGVGGHWALYSSRLAVEEARRNLARRFPHCLDRAEGHDSGFRTVDGRAGQDRGASASTFHGTDMPGGANGGRIRLAPQRDWAAGDGGERLVHDFVQAWTKVMTLDRFDLLD